MKTLICGVLLAAAAIPAWAVNFSGKWALQSPAGRGGGRGGPTILILTQVGKIVTGTISVRIDAGSNSPVNAEIWDGKVEGDALSFYVWTGTDQPAKTTYTGTMPASGDEIVFTVTGGRGAAGGLGMGTPPAARGGQAGRGGQAAPQQITATRAM